MSRLVLWNWFKPSSKILLQTVPRRYFFRGSFVFFMSCVCHAFESVLAVLWSHAGKGLASWLLFVMFIVFLSLSHLVSWVRCGTWLYWFLIFALFLTLFQLLHCTGLSRQIDSNLGTNRVRPISAMYMKCYSIKHHSELFVQFHGIISRIYIIGLHWSLDNDPIETMPIYYSNISYNALKKLLQHAMTNVVERKMS